MKSNVSGSGWNNLYLNKPVILVNIVKVDRILIQCTTIGLFQESHFYNRWVTVTTTFKPGLCIFTYELKF